MNIYVANIPSKASATELKKLFECHGELTSVKIIMAKLTNRSRGFGFIEMADGTSARQAIQELNGCHFLEKYLVMNEAQPKDDSHAGNENCNGGGDHRRW